MPPKKRRRTTAPVPKLYQVLSHAHIRDTVLEELPYPSLLALRAVSKIWREPVDVFLLRHIIIKEPHAGRLVQWEATNTLGRIPRKNWHRSMKMIEQIKCLDIQRHYTPAWTANVRHLNRLRYQPPYHNSVMVGYPTTPVRIRSEGGMINRLLDTNFTSEPVHVIISLSTQQTTHIPTLDTNLRSLTVLAIYSASTYYRPFKKSYGTLFVHLRNFVAQVLLKAHGDDPPLPVTLAGLESWYGLPRYSRNYDPDKEVFESNEAFMAAIRDKLIREVSADQADILLRRLTYMKLDDYRNRVGDERFMFETGGWCVGERVGV